jgi:CheY-like chemotaxis protein
MTTREDIWGCSWITWVQMSCWRGMRLKASTQLKGSVPVIAMTALVGHADRARMLNAGFQACLPKPFTPAKLEETILTVLDK